MPAAHQLLLGGVGVLNASLAAAVQTAPADNIGLEPDEGERATSGPDPDNIQEGPRSRTEGTGNTSANTAARSVGTRPVHRNPHEHHAHPLHHAHHHHR